MSNTRRHPTEPELIKRILEVRLTDLEEERRLCKQLLDVADAEQSSYGFAFANIHLADCLLALGEYSDCDFYLIRANYLCREEGFEDLLLMLCNVAGLFYQSLNDEQTALRYYLEGLSLAESAGDRGMESKFLNNIGRSFALRRDWATAESFLLRAFEAVEPFLDDESARSNAVSYLCNLAEVREQLGEKEPSEAALILCESLVDTGAYQRFRLSCSWCSYHAVFKDRENLLAKVDELLAEGFLEFENRFFVADMVAGLCDLMLDVGDKPRAETLLEFLAETYDDAALASQYAVQGLKIRFSRLFESDEDLSDLYREYYTLFYRMQDQGDEARAQSLLSQIRLDEAQTQRAVLGRENRVLEKIGRHDELTGLYSRRYFSKIVTKAFQSEHPSTLGFVLIDVDNFKQYNDLNGHFLGDGALKAVAEVLFRHVVDGISACRYGGDEFVCLCVDVDDASIASFVDRVLEGLRERKIAHGASDVSPFLTLSIGWCNEAVVETLDPSVLFQVADQALYQVKGCGRDGQARMFA